MSSSSAQRARGTVRHLPRSSSVDHNFAGLARLVLGTARSRRPPGRSSGQRNDCCWKLDTSASRQTRHVWFVAGRHRGSRRSGVRGNGARARLGTYYAQRSSEVAVYINSPTDIVVRRVRTKASISATDQGRASNRAHGSQSRSTGPGPRSKRLSNARLLVTTDREDGRVAPSRGAIISGYASHPGTGTPMHRWTSVHVPVR